MKKIFFLPLLILGIFLTSCEGDDNSEENEMEDPIPTGLEFTFITSTTTANGSLLSTNGGMTSSENRNSLYFSERDKGTEVVKTYNISTNTWSTNIYEESQFVTKRLHIINDRLLVLGGQYINIYDLPVDGDPVVTNFHDLKYSKYSSAAKDQNIYFLGNENNIDGTNQDTGLLKRYNVSDNQFSDIATFTDAKLDASAEIVGNTYYVFGGSNNFPLALYSDFNTTISKVDLTSGSVSTLNIMPEKPIRVYTAKKGSFIYVGYETRTDTNGDGDAAGDDKTINFGIYNTQDNSFTVLDHNLDDSDLYSSISNIEIINNKLYVSYGNPQFGSNEVNIFAADLQ